MKTKPASRKMAAKKAAAKRAAPARKKPVKPIPDDYHVVTPYLALKGAGAAIEFYKKVFGARERLRMEGPDGMIGHAELKIGDSVVMLADEFPQMDFLGPQTRGGTAVTLYLYVKDCDAVFRAALAAGARERRPLKDEFYGDRTGMVEDPWGHVWHISTHKEDLSKAELRKRAEAAMKEMAGEGGSS